MFAFKSNWFCVAVLTGFNKSLVLSTFDKSTIAFVIPWTFPLTLIFATLKSNMLALRHILSLVPKLPERLK